MYVCTCVPIMTTKLCPFYTEFGSFPYVFSSSSPIHALLISFVPFSSSLSCFELCRTNVSQPLRKRFHFNPARIHSKSQSVWAGILSWRRLSNFILQHFAVCLVVYDLPVASPECGIIFQKLLEQVHLLLLLLSLLIFCVCSSFVCILPSLVCVSLGLCLMVIQSLPGSTLELSVSVGMDGVAQLATRMSTAA